MASERMRILIRKFGLNMLRSLRYTCLGTGPARAALGSLENSTDLIRCSVRLGPS